MQIHTNCAAMFHTHTGLTYSVVTASVKFTFTESFMDSHIPVVTQVVSQVSEYLTLMSYVSFQNNLSDYMCEESKQKTR